MITDAFQLPHLEQSPRLWALALNLTLAPCVGGLEEETSDRVILVMMSEKRLDPLGIKDLLTQALVEHRGERLPTHPDTPMLDEFMQRSSWRLAIHCAKTAELRSLHTTQTEIWLRDETGEIYPVLCQAFSSNPSHLDEMLNAASTFGWKPPQPSGPDAE